LQLRFLEIPDEKVKRVNALIKLLEKGYGEITYNNNKLTPEKIYQTISDGGFFYDDEEARKSIEQMSQVPAMAHLLRYNFFDYSLRGFEIVSALFDIILQIEHSVEDEASAREVAIENRCIYCSDIEGSFTSEEHIIPESLGNDELILPKGFVCDACNNDVLSDLDNALIRFEPVAYFQVMYVPYTKAGKFPKASFSNITIERKGPRHIKMTPKNKGGELKNHKQIGDGLYSFNHTWKGKKINWNLIGRALYKIALGLVALERRQEQACNSKSTPPQAVEL
jgi:hypothetical protein